MSLENFIVAVNRTTDVFLDVDLSDLVCFAGSQGTYDQATFDEKDIWVSKGDLEDTVEVLQKSNGDFQALKEVLKEWAQDEELAETFCEERRAELESILAESDEIIKELEKLTSLSQHSYIIHKS